MAGSGSPGGSDRGGGTWWGAGNRKSVKTERVLFRSTRGSHMTDRLVLPDWPRLMDEPQAGEYLSIGKTMLREHGPKPKRLGRRVLYDRRDLDRWADRLGGQPLDERQEQEEA